MTSINKLKRELEIVRRALYPTPFEQECRKGGEAITRLLREYSQQVEAEVAALTEEGSEN